MTTPPDRLTMRQQYGRIAILIALPVAFIALIPSSVGLFLLARYADHNCTAAQANRAAIRQTLLATFVQLGYRYDEKLGKAVPDGKPLAYYVEHPGEAARALKLAVETVERFPPITCDYLWTF